MKTWLELSASALRENYRQISNDIAPAKAMAVLKSNAYGHGLVEAGMILKDLAHSFAVDRVEEGSVLREAGIRQQILVLGYVEDRQGLRDAIDLQLDLAISSFEQLEQLHFTTQEQGAQGEIQIHLEVETGLYRLGLPESDLDRVIALLGSQSVIKVRGLFTHFASAEEDLDGGFAQTQQERFAVIREKMLLAGIKIEQSHMACSAAGLTFRASHYDVVRLGISLYGLWSSEQVRTAVQGSRNLSLLPALVWKTVVAQVKSVAKDETVGYSRSERLTRDSRIAILPIGYYDCYPRSLSSRGIVVIHGQRCRIIGRICMNMCMVDVTHVIRPIVPGTEVTLIGSGIDAEELATLAGTIHYELVARLPSELPRLVVD